MIKKRTPYKISGKFVGRAIGFGYDGCHKIYVAESDDEVAELKRLGYEMHPMDDLERFFVESCPLRFIAWANLDKAPIVPQCRMCVTFVYGDGSRSVCRFD